MGRLEPQLGGERRTQFGVDYYRQAQERLAQGKRSEAADLLRQAIEVDSDDREAADLLRIIEDAEEAQNSDFRDSIFALVLLALLVVSVIGPTLWLLLNGVSIWRSLIVGLATTFVGGGLMVVSFVTAVMTVEWTQEGSEPAGCLYIGLPVSVLMFIGTLVGSVLFLNGQVN